MTEPIDIKWGIRQGDTICPKLLNHPRHFWKVDVGECIKIRR